MSGILTPGVWAAQLAKSLKSKTVLEEIMARRPLDTRDVWAPTGETYAEAVAWSRLLGVQVVRPAAESPFRDCMVLTRAGAVPHMMACCAPGALIDVIKQYAGGSPKPDYPPASP